MGINAWHGSTGHCFSFSAFWNSLWNCSIDIGMFSVIDPISGEQYNISAIADGQSVSMPVEWPVEITDFQWALYNQNGELCVEATTDISQAESGVTLLLTGDGNLDDVQEIFE